MTAVASSIRFHHSGNFGDLIYGLPVVRKFGPADLEISVRAWGDPGQPLNRPIMPQDFEIIAPLLRAQPYIRSVTHRGLNGNEAIPMTVGAKDLDLWRRRPADNIAHCHLKLLREVDGSELRKPWIEVDPLHVAPIVISRSIRWHEPGAETTWLRVIAAASGRAVFVGRQEDWQRFEADFGPIDFYPTTNLLHAARIIAGSVAFVGNQSACLAIAQAMHHPRIAYERFTPKNNCAIAEIPTVKFDEAHRLESFLAHLS